MIKKVLNKICWFEKTIYLVDMTLELSGHDPILAGYVEFRDIEILNRFIFRSKKKKYLYGRPKFDSNGLQVAIIQDLHDEYKIKKRDHDLNRLLNNGKETIYLIGKSVTYYH